jgi:hypothetical protein
VAIHSTGAIWDRKVARTLPACRDALEAVVNRLEDERKVLLAEIEKQSERYGANAEPGKNPALKKIDEGLHSARSFLQQLPFRDHQQYKQVIDFVLDTEDGEQNR